MRILYRKGEKVHATPRQPCHEVWTRLFTRHRGRIPQKLLGVQPESIPRILSVLVTGGRFSFWIPVFHCFNIEVIHIRPWNNGLDSEPRQTSELLHPV